MTKLIQLTDVSAGYNDTIVLRDVNFEINDRDFIGVIGPNGGGKTTLIKVLLGLLKPARGTVTRFDDASDGFIGYLPQTTQVDKKFPITVLDIVLSGLMSSRGRVYRYSRHDNDTAHQLLAQMGIGGLAHRTSKELSGGQLQRVFICRALISNPRLLILDEPNTYVDNRFESDLYERLIELNKKMAIIIVSHDVGTISYYVKTIACVNEYLHYHRSNIITEQQLADYNCPLQIITHGDVPHTVLQKHEHDHSHNHESHD
ncbi:MAG TPA: ABC transporter ATP-binding protein [Bacteroidales bacterium]|jgi:zinc transport system ATP-binding protein|nr:ABC transporter ATP-binding protein [Bacteroidales bacterium]